MVRRQRKNSFCNSSIHNNSLFQFITMPFQLKLLDWVLSSLSGFFIGKLGKTFASKGCVWCLIGCWPSSNQVAWGNRNDMLWVSGKEELCEAKTRRRNNITCDETSEDEAQVHHLAVSNSCPTLCLSYFLRGLIRFCCRHQSTTSRSHCHTGQTL